MVDITYFKTTIYEIDATSLFIVGIPLARPRLRYSGFHVREPERNVERPTGARQDCPGPTKDGPASIGPPRR